MEYIETWKVGEVSGKLTESVQRLGQTTGERAEMFLGEFCRWMPRLIYCLIAIWIIFQIFSMLSIIGEAAGR